MDALPIRLGEVRSEGGDGFGTSRADHRRSQKCTRCRRRERSDHCGRPPLSSDRLDSRTTCWQGVPHGRSSSSSKPPTRPKTIGLTMAQPRNKVPQSCCSLGGHREKNLGSTRANARSGERARVHGPEHGRGARLAGRMTLGEAVLKTTLSSYV